jgi:hypothetical protein
MELELWLNQALLIRQNQLKADFLSLFEDVANSVTNEELKLFFPEAKGKKISKGNQLDGFPYLVLDLVRDFDLNSGCVIRLVSWWGHGVYFCIFFGENLPAIHTEYFLTEGFSFGKTDSPWDLPELILPGNSSSSLEEIRSRKAGFQLWFKEVKLQSDRESNKLLLEKEIRKILKLNLI